jgi:hypothetical protein
MKMSRTGITVSALPGTVMFGLFCSLALHMHRSLGGWPQGIGELGFSRTLAFHAAVATDYCVALVLISVFVLPLAAVFCAAVPRWRRFLPYLTVYFLVLVGCWGVAHLAPAAYLNWWRD